MTENGIRHQCHRAVGEAEQGGIYRLIREATVTREVLIRWRESSVDDNIEGEYFAAAEVIEVLDFVPLDVVSAMRKHFLSSRTKI